ncbi:hypothetical protein E1298_12670 [Actinomadura rubrisoli]|uniref:Uncharacterized protein n=1 Tax=Actinomadura rubrisoli TaxID=2530368 RepID=A0A4R5BX32_9ACTN|nr:hypothetical protein E1298_12670 [Actinomadura rubrisoli]
MPPARAAPPAGRGIPGRDRRGPQAVLLGEVARPLITALGDGQGAWLEEQRERARADRLFLVIPMFVAAAIRPRTG